MNTLKLIRIVALFILVSSFNLLIANEDSPPEKNAACHYVSSDGMAFAWLAKQQRNDGFWGEEENRIKLTCLASLSYITYGEVPGNSKYSDTIKNALVALMREASNNRSLNAEEDALLTWCFSEAYGRTLHPHLLESCQKQARKLKTAQVTPWKLLAAQSLKYNVRESKSIATNIMAEFQSTYPMQTNSLLNQATHALLGMYNDDRYKPDLEFERTKQINPASWKSQEFPLQTIYLLNQVLFPSDGWNWDGWYDKQRKDILRRQRVKKSLPQDLGWWTVDGLGIPKPKEVESMNEKEDAVYATCMMLLTLYRPIRNIRLPAIPEKAFAVEEQIMVIDADDIDVDPGDL